MTLWWRSNDNQMTIKLHWDLMTFRWHTDNSNDLKELKIQKTTKWDWLTQKPSIKRRREVCYSSRCLKNISFALLDAYKKVVCLTIWIGNSKAIKLYLISWFYFPVFHDVWVFHGFNVVLHGTLANLCHRSNEIRQIWRDWSTNCNDIHDGSHRPFR